MPSSTPLLIAHRGESFDAPENTQAAFDLAWERGCDAIELDVHHAADGQIVVCHDRDTQRTAGVKHVIAESSLATLAALDVGQWKAPRWAGQRIATLEAVLERVPAGKQVFLEIKSGIDAVEPVAAIIDRFPAIAITVIAFNIDVVRLMKQHRPRTPALWLVSPRRDESSGQWTPTPASMLEQAKAVGADGLDIDALSPIDAEFVRRVHEAGMQLMVWTVDDPTRARHLAAVGVDGITSNRAAWLREQLAARS